MKDVVDPPLSSPPRTLFLIVTSACDISCAYCFYTTGHERRDGRRFDAATLPAFIARLKALNFQSVILTGGDPLGRKYKAIALVVVRELVSAGFKVIINSSGAYLTYDDCVELVAANPYRIDFSIDSHDAAKHDQLRGRFEDTVASIRTLRSLGYDRIVSTTVVTGINEGDLEETSQFLKEVGVVERRFQPGFLPPGTAEHVPELVHRFQGKCKEAILKNIPASSWKNEYLKLWEYYFGGPSGRDRRPGPRCVMGKECFIADAEGNMFPCFHRTDIKIGNLFTSPLETLRISIDGNEVGRERLPCCCGAHCVSLFDTPLAWPKSRATEATVAEATA